MTEKNNTKRLDEILIEKGLATESQIKVALKHQKVYGGKFGSHLLHHSFIDESALIEALSIQYNCKGVVLSELDIPKSVLDYIPPSVAIARKIIPILYDEDSNILKIACEDPNSESLIREIQYVVPGKKIELVIAAELSILSALGKYYVGQPAVIDSSDEQLEQPAAKKQVIDEFHVPADINTNNQATAKSVLLVSDDKDSYQIIQTLFEGDGFEIEISESADDAIELTRERIFDIVLIKDSVAGDYLDLVDRLRKNSLKTKVKFFESTSGLILGELTIKNLSSVHQKNLELFTSLLSIKQKLPFNTGGAVAYYVEKLTRKLKLPVKERFLIINAAYVHDIAKYYYPSDESRDFRTIIKLTTKLLNSINYEPVVVEMLKSMYIDLKNKYNKRLPIEVLGGNILTITDLFCDSVVVNEQLTLDRFDSIQTKINDMIGKLFLSEVADAFIEMIEAEILKTTGTHRFNQVMIFSNQPESTYPLDLRLKKEGFRTFLANSRESFIQLYKRSTPDTIVFDLHGKAKEVKSTISFFHENSINFEETPVFLLTDGKNIADISSLLEIGIEDIIDSETSLDILILKIKKIKSHHESELEKMIEAEILGSREGENHSQIIIYSDLPESTYSIDLKLKNEGLRTFMASSKETFVKIFERSKPDIVLFDLHGNKKEIFATLDYFKKEKIQLDSCHSFLLANNESVSDLSSFLEMGIEDIIDSERSLDILIMKVKKIINQLKEERRKENQLNQKKSGTNGNLSDINLIDLLQALGPSQRTTKITVSSDMKCDDHLVIYLERGAITFAMLGDIGGADAIYHAMRWETGSWHLEPVKKDDLPEPNNFHSNEFIMMEGCRLIDEISN